MFSLIEQLESRQMMSVSSFTSIGSTSLLSSTSVYTIAPKAPVISPTTSLGGLYTPVTTVTNPFPIGTIFTPAPPPGLPTPIIQIPGNLPVIIGTIPHVTPAYVSNGVLTVEGRLNANKIGVDVSGANYVVTLNGSTYNFASAGVTGIKITGGVGADSIALGVAVNIPATIRGDAGNDSIVGGSAGDQLFGEDGNDLLTGAGGADLLSGGNGFDTVAYQEKTRGVVVTLDGVANDGTPFTIQSTGPTSRARIYQAENDNAMADVEGVKGSGYADVLTGNAAANVLNGYEGNDQLNGLDGNDSLYGGYGDDQLNGNNGDDQMWGEGGDDVYSGGLGTDAARYDEGGRLLGVNVTIDGIANDGGSYEKDNVKTDVENLYGTEGNDVFLGTAAANAFFGEGGQDQLFGLGGNDVLFGGNGDDGLFGGDGNDYMVAGDGNDVVFGGFGNDTGYGGNGDDLVHGDAGDDQVYGQAGNDRVYGDDGNDAVNGDEGKDQLFGGAGFDALQGGAGDDVLVTVGGGIDRLTGGDGYDSFWYDAPVGLFATPIDTVTDAVFNETASGALHPIGNFSNSVSTGPFSFNKAPVSKDLLGQNLTDPLPVVAGTAFQNFKGNPLFAANGPTGDDVDQNALGDCWFMATLSATARSDSNVIRQSIVDLGDGTYAVKFRQAPFSTQDIYIRVDADLPIASPNTPVYAGLGKGNSLWVALMEKAYTWVRGQDGTAVQPGYLTDAAGTTIEAAGNLALTPAGGSTGFPSIDNAGNWIRDRVYTNKAVLISTKANGGNPLFVANHVYAVTGITQIAPGNWTITMRNPWAKDGGTYSDGANDGYVTVPLGAILGSMTRIDSFAVA